MTTKRHPITQIRPTLFLDNANHDLAKKYEELLTPSTGGFSTHIVAKSVPNKISTLNGLKKWTEKEKPHWLIIDAQKSRLMAIKELSAKERSNTWTLYRGIPIIYLI